MSWISVGDSLPEFEQIVIVRYVMCDSMGMNPTAHAAFGRLSEKGWCDREAAWEISSTLSSRKFCRGGMKARLSHDFVTHWFAFPPIEPVPEQEVENQNKRIEDYINRAGARRRL